MERYETPRFEKIDLTAKERIAVCMDDFIEDVLISPTFIGGILSTGCEHRTYWTATDY